MSGNIFENAVEGIGNTFSGGLNQLNESPVWQNLSKAATYAILGYALGGAGAAAMGGGAGAAGAGAGGAGGAGGAAGAGFGEGLMGAGMGEGAGAAAGTGSAGLYGGAGAGAMGADAGYMGDYSAAGYDPYYANESGVGAPTSLGTKGGGTNWFNLASKGMKFANALSGNGSQGQQSGGGAGMDPTTAWVNSQNAENKRMMLAQNLRNQKRMEDNQDTQYG